MTKTCLRGSKPLREKKIKAQKMAKRNMKNSSYIDLKNSLYIDLKMIKISYYRFISN